MRVTRVVRQLDVLLQAVPMFNSVRAALELDTVLPSLTPLSSQGVYSWQDLSYSDHLSAEHEAHEKHQVDVFISAQPFPRPKQPVCLFVHGGAWQRGDRRHRLNTYQNIGIGCARAGIVGVVMSYRLAPQAMHPQQVSDVAAACSWVHDNIHKYGGCAQNVFLCGHSAGAHLALLAAAQPRWLEQVGLHPNWLRGIIGISGVYNLVRLAQTPLGPYLVEPAFGEDPEAWREASPVHYTGASSPLRHKPLLLVNAASDFHLEQDAEELEQRLLPPAADAANADKANNSGDNHLQSISNIERVSVPTANHVTVIAAVGQEDDPTTQILTDWILEHSELCE